MLPQSFSNPINILLGIGLLIVVFILFREIVTWYWKINKTIDILERIEKNTRGKKEDSAPQTKN